MAVLITAVNATAQLASVVNSSLPLPEPLLPSNPLGPSINTMTLYSLLITTLLVAAANVLATAGGIGGGGFLVPILTAVMEIHDAVPLSKALIFAANLVVLVGNWNVVDFEAAAMMQPASLAGTIVGELTGPERGLSEPSQTPRTQFSDFYFLPCHPLPSDSTFKSIL